MLFAIFIYFLFFSHFVPFYHAYHPNASSLPKTSENNNVSYYQNIIIVTYDLQAFFEIIVKTRFSVTQNPI